MKLFGSSRSSKHASGHTQGAARGAGERSGGKKKKSRARVAVTVVAVILAMLAVLALTAVIYIKTQAKPPAQTMAPNNPGYTRPGASVLDRGDTPPAGTNGDEQEPDDNADAPDNDDAPGRVEGVYTFLVVAKDKVGANTDGIMVAKFDTNDYTLNVASIPRDTLVNVSTRNKKVNALYANGKEAGLVEGIADLMGYEPDFYCLVTLDAIEKVVNAIGGVKYDVPQKMDYDDPAQDLHIHFKAGTQTLNGKQAVEYMRFRKGYSDQDLGRIEAQHSFLGTMASQVLANKSKVPVTTIVNIVMNDVKTSLDLGECTWFAKELLKMDGENVKFFTMPGEWYGSVKGSGYQVIDTDEWIKMVNDYLNPFDKDLKESNFDIISVNSSNKLYATSGYIQTESWRNNPSIKSGGSTTSKPATSTPSTTKPSTTTPSDTTASDTKPSDTTPSDTTPSDTTPSDTTPSDTTPSDTTPSDTTPSDTTPSDTTPTDTDPGEEEPTPPPEFNTDPGEGSGEPGEGAGEPADPDGGSVTVPDEPEDPGTPPPEFAWEPEEESDIQPQS